MKRREFLGRIGRLSATFAAIASATDKPDFTMKNGYSVRLVPSKGTAPRSCKHRWDIVRQQCLKCGMTRFEFYEQAIGCQDE